MRRYIQLFFPRPPLWRIFLKDGQDMIQLTIKYYNQFFAFEGISRTALCSDILSLLDCKVSGNARLMENGRFLSMCETIDKVHLIFFCPSWCSIKVFLKIVLSAFYFIPVFTDVIR